MKKIFENKRAIAPIFIIFLLILILLGVYIFLFIPIPAFTKLRMIINYFLILMLWIFLQIGLVYAYVKLGTFLVRLMTKGYKRVSQWSLKFERFLINR